MADIESEFICAACSANIADQQKVIASGIAPKMFLSKNAEANYLFGYLDKYGKFPSLRIFKMHFPRFTVNAVTEPSCYYVDKLLERTVYTNIQKIIGNVSKHLRDTGIGAVQDCVKEMLSAQELLRYGYSGDVSWDKWNAYDNYTNRENNHTLWITPYRILNRMIRGIRAKQLVTIAGRPAISKTWILLYMALSLWEQGAKVLFIEKEMGQEEIYERADAIYMDIDWIRFLEGRISKAEMKKHEATRKEVFSKRANAFIVSDTEDLTSNDVASVLGKIIEHQPDVVFIDGAYLLEEAVGKSFTEKAAAVSRATKRLARNRNVPIFQTLQMNRQAEESGGGLETLAWSDSYAQDSDVIIQVKGKKEESVREIELLKGRTLTGGMGSFYINAVFSPRVDLSELGAVTHSNVVELSTVDG